ncbi:heme-binding domain-containing protein [soil metagenome]
MKKILKPIGYVLLIALVIIQFFRPTKNIDTSGNLVANDISKAYYVPQDVQTILENSCYDCHSNNTAYPWYSKLQPVAWWLQDHIDEGKKEINFSEFATYRIGRKYKKLEEIIKEVKEDEMPLSSYTLIHRYAILSSEQKERINKWATSIRDTIKATTPADSLVRKKV